MKVKWCMYESNTNSAHIMEGSEPATHIHEGDMGIIIDHFLFIFSG